MHLPSRGDRESENCASFSPAGQIQHHFLNLREHVFNQINSKTQIVEFCHSKMVFACYCLFPHILACVGTDVRTCSGTRESWISPLVNHCVHFHCVFLCTCPFMTTPKIQQSKAEQENIYMPTRNRAFPIFPFPTWKNSLSRSQRLNKSFPSSSDNEPIYLWFKMT